MGSLDELELAIEFFKLAATGAETFGEALAGIGLNSDSGDDLVITGFDNNSGEDLAMFVGDGLGLVGEVTVVRFSGFLVWDSETTASSELASESKTDVRSK